MSAMPTDDVLRLRMPTKPATWVDINNPSGNLSLNVNHTWYPQNPNGAPLKIRDDDGTWKEVTRLLPLKPRGITLRDFPSQLPDVGAQPYCCSRRTVLQSSYAPGQDFSSPNPTLVAESEYLISRGTVGGGPPVNQSDNEQFTSVAVFDVALLRRAVPRFSRILVATETITNSATFENLVDSGADDRGPLAGEYFGYLHQINSIDVDTVAMQYPNWAASLPGRVPTSGAVSGPVLFTWTANSTVSSEFTASYTPQQIPDNGLLIFGLTSDLVPIPDAPTELGFNSNTVTFEVSIAATIFP